ncbi:hypothetical protein HOU03_gp272 [Caulobacter phage CcrSC]|uniref:Uncharacterized protein n=1 Tax=Caulobacter phage CcrSC TaxID=2283272 RepID=A0A385EEA3_9CAUD|nr:hypothetical protein HOU03_gp272 [Caulobacter phage CcrSC]AXQ69996.1 hypothetical protein CcrSC_gp414 [Caulobacter phage CcrSC]
MKMVIKKTTGIHFHWFAVLVIAALFCGAGYVIGVQVTPQQVSRPVLPPAQPLKITVLKDGTLIEDPRTGCAWIERGWMGTSTLRGDNCEKVVR